MTKFLVLICVLFGLTAAVDTTGACLYTAPFKAAVEFSAASIAMTTPKAYSDLKYCTSLASGACCTDTDINNIQAKNDAITKNLTTLVSTRDQYITTVKTTVLPTLLTNIQNFNQIAVKFEQAFEQQITAALGNIDLSDLDMDETDLNVDETDLDVDETDMDDEDSSFGVFAIVAAFSEITNVTTKFLTNVDSIKNNYVNYQNDRRTCVLDLLDVQNSAMCLACDPNAATKGFANFAIELAEASDDDIEIDESELDDESDDEELDASEEEALEEFLLGFGIAMSTATCSRLQTSCNPYIALADGQNTLVELTAASAQFSGLITAMQTFIDGKTDDAMTQFEKVMEANDSTAGVPALTSGAIPYGCNTNSNTGCEWVCAGLFRDGMVDLTALLVGGEYDDGEDDEGDDGIRRRVLAEKRRLADDGTWAPAKGDSGVTVAFAADPAGTDNSKKFGSLSLGNMFVGMMVVISSILLL